MAAARMCERIRHQTQGSHTQEMIPLSRANCVAIAAGAEIDTVNRKPCQSRARLSRVILVPGPKACQLIREAWPGYDLKQ